VHSKVEFWLTEKVGEAGKKIHTARSRNDQVLVDLHLWARDQVKEVLAETGLLFDQLMKLAEAHADKGMPGYTHMQVAMPSSFGVWFSAYAETLIDDVLQWNAAFSTANQNPLGSAAGYGSNFPIDREMTTQELAFGTLRYNVVAAQMSRGRLEKAMSFAISSLAATLNKLATDICLYMGQDFGFVTFPDHLTTGSSIMPHKKNPDVWELIRGQTNRLQAVPTELSLMTTNQPSGYHRDYQLLKDVLFPAMTRLHSCLDLSTYMLAHIQVKEGLLQKEKYDLLFTVEAVNAKVVAGVPFRDAYREVGAAVEAGTYQPNRDLNHTHQGSLGNLCLPEIRKKWEGALHQDK
ncbi:MAG: argininosuccinate lyase, partial [Bacteroidota bacterium]